MSNAELRRLSRQVNDFGYPTQAARLAGHAFDANRIEVRTAQQRDTRRRDPIKTLGEARASARYNRTPRAWSRYGEIRQAVVSPLSVTLP